MLTLGLETSCDETSVAVVRSGREKLANVILSQTDHARFGGVVPEVASRAHLRTIVPVYEQCLEEAQLTLDDIDLIAATVGPGLVGPLLVGLSFAKGLALATGKPLVGVHHMEGHLAANLLEHPELDQRHLTLIVSGGHTMLVEVNPFGTYTVLGQTKDDAAGEAFDKIGKLLGLGYPGGARLDALARDGDPRYVRFPRPLKSKAGFQFSFSGLKTAVAIYLGKLSETERDEHLADIAASFQEAAVEVLVDKTVRAAEETGVRHVTISGGVAANSRLREALGLSLRKIGRKLFFPSTELCTDNAAMIATAGYLRYEIDGASELAINAVPYLKLDDL
jgi:N6-L-threonylcarbamoyladenine synthase